MIVVTAACQGCGACLLTCPERAIRPAHRAARGAGPLAVLPQLCNDCGECIEVCPADAISFAGGYCAHSWSSGEGETA
jgi:electron transport complex protein RnfB